MQKFSFDTVFDVDGGAYQPPRPKRSYTADEVEAIREAAFREGEASAVARAEEAAARALREASDVMRAGLSALAEVAHEHRTASAELALSCARKIAVAALDRAPEAPAVAALEALGRELENAPRVIVHMSTDDEARLTEALAGAAARCGYEGAVVVKPALGMGRAAFTFDWGEGRAAFDPEAAAARIAETLANALAAEGLHAELVAPVIPSPEDLS